MSDQTVLLSILVPKEAKAALFADAHRRSIEAGKTISVGHLVREAIAKHTCVEIPPSAPAGRPAGSSLAYRHRSRPAAVLEG